jgi:uncharacterized protein involved in cysteine biosynthesis
MSEHSKRPGFSAGFGAVFTGFGTIAREPRLWPWALVPALCLGLLEAGFVALAFTLLKPWVVAHFPEASSRIGRLGVEVAGALAALAVAAVGWFVAVALAPALSAPALEKIVKEVERAQGLPSRPSIGFFAEMLSGFRAMTGAALLGLPLFSLLFALGFALPALAIVTTPLKFVLSSLLVAWGLFDYPLTLRGVGFRERLRFARRNLACFAGFGLAFALVFWLPCCGVVLLPVGVAAATLLVGAIERARLDERGASVVLADRG